VCDRKSTLAIAFVIKINKTKKRIEELKKKIRPIIILSRNEMGEIHNELFDLVRIKRSTIYPEFQKEKRLISRVFDPSTLFLVLLNVARPRNVSIEMPAS
jgi:hypothetical protein